MLENQINNLRQLRYKFYIFVILILFIIIYPYFQDLKGKVAELNVQVKNLKSEIISNDRELNLLKDINKRINYLKIHKKEIIACINNFSNCNLKIKTGDLLLAKSYFMFSKFEKDKKMDYNQKEILSDIVTFFQNTQGKINVISFSNVKKFDKLKDIYYVDITLNADFPRYKGSFEKFLDRVENKVFLDSIHNLYYIKNISYDILDYTKPQTVTINMSVYFYK